MGIMGQILLYLVYGAVGDRVCKSLKGRFGRFRSSPKLSI
ncbi:hypothetical protein AVDCRST_MAG84-148 [uncultured Microcoleus sp.]|uniref:Uncharacterized protein n=1 Tax=uncultured Microcoleus sp. TaxID=259945 RepID=A0A6J4KBZ6_9CYAN|nr:hypothetical protein AVDCRST_MAG84-148 [uncultured Microcoleus sp.]